MIACKERAGIRIRKVVDESNHEKESRGHRNAYTLVKQLEYQRWEESEMMQ